MNPSKKVIHVYDVTIKLQVRSVNMFRGSMDITNKVSELRTSCSEVIGKPSIDFRRVKPMSKKPSHPLISCGTKNKIKARVSL